MNTGCCPKTSRDANGYNRNCRFKVFLNVAKAVAFTSYSAKTQRWNLYRSLFSDDFKPLVELLTSGFLDYDII